MHINRALRSLVNAQWGYFTARQALAAGYTKHLQSYHARSGNWIRVDRALYRLPGYADSLEAEFTRWSLWAIGQCPQRQVAVSHASALHYYGLIAQKPQCIDLTVSELRFKAEAAGCQLHLETLEPHEHQEREGFCITTVSRTLRDMRPDLVFGAQWLPAIREALEKGLLTENEACVLAAPVALEELTRRSRESAITVCPGRTSEEREMAGGFRRMVGVDARGAGGGLMRGRSFTLVEMLVVIAIICILAGLLLPSLNRAVGSARQAQCANNLRQLYLSFTRYADDLNGVLVYNPFSYIYALRDVYPDDFPGAKMWSKSSYGRQIWHCPACPLNSVADSNSNGASDYGMNVHASRTPPETSSSSTNPTARMSKAAPRPGEKFLLADIGINSARAGFYAIYPDRMASSLQHDGRLNMLFFDGHATSRDDPYEICRWTSWGAYYADVDKRPFNTQP